MTISNSISHETSLKLTKFHHKSTLRYRESIIFRQFFSLSISKMSNWSEQIFWIYTDPKQPSRGVFRKRCFQNMQQIYRRTPMPKCMQSNSIEITLRHGCSPVNLLHIFRTLFLRNTSGQLLLTITIFALPRSNCSSTVIHTRLSSVL